MHTKLWIVKHPFQKSLALFCAGFLSLTACSPSKEGTGPRTTSYANLYKVGLALREYESEHGTLPDRLSELVPRYIPLSEIGIFYVTNHLATKQAPPKNWEHDSELIDIHSSYVYLGKRKVQNVLAYERTDLWKHTTEKHAVLFTDFHVQYISSMQLQELLVTTNALERVNSP